jgi:predicted DNA-binding protein
MGVISVRLNKEEERILKELSDNLGVDKSTLIKKSIFELYENLVDMEIIEKFEDKERKGKVSFITAEDILN